jgi:hypothetical protein
MEKYDDALRRYAFEVHKRDRFTCRYCGAYGTKLFETWLTLTRNHLLPKGHPNRDNPDFIVIACAFCHSADNRYFDLAMKRGLRFDGMTPEELIVQRMPYVQKARRDYREFWERRVIVTRELEES